MLGKEIDKNFQSLLSKKYGVDFSAQGSRTIFEQLDDADAFDKKQPKQAKKKLIENVQPVKKCDVLSESSAMHNPDLDKTVELLGGNVSDVDEKETLVSCQEEVIDECGDNSFEPVKECVTNEEVVDEGIFDGVKDKFRGAVKNLAGKYNAEDEKAAAEQQEAEHIQKVNAAAHDSSMEQELGRQQDIANKEQEEKDRQVRLAQSKEEREATQKDTIKAMGTLKKSNGRMNAIQLADKLGLDKKGIMNIVKSASKMGIITFDKNTMNIKATKSFKPFLDGYNLAVRLAKGGRQLDAATLQGEPVLETLLTRGAILNAFCEAFEDCSEE